MKLTAVAMFIAAAMPWGMPSAEAAETALWSIGSPTGQEQLYLELINRARASPSAEGVRLATTTDADVLAHYSGFGVNLLLLQTELSLLPARPPLAMNAKLITSARAHSLDEFTNSFQSHTGSNGSNIPQRITAAGYAWANYGENTYTNSRSTWFGHASFEVDWGPGGAGGMQLDRKHRVLIHSPDFKEIGIGLYEGSKGFGATAFGPQVVTQDFGMPAGPAIPFLSGVVFYDFNGNAFYDPGEGIGGVTVNADGAAWHSETASSGGYAIPLPAGTAQRTVSFTGLGFNTSINTLVTGTTSVKVDLKPSYLPPVVSGPAAPGMGTAGFYAISKVNGATEFECKVIRKNAVAAAASDNAENLTRVIASISPSYSALSAVVKQQGTGAYRLAQPANRTEAITYQSTFLGGAAPVLRYQSRLGAASATQSALVQTSTDRGLTWITAETQAGSGGAGQTIFSQRTVNLTAAIRKEFLLRFAFTVTGATANNSTADGAGWYIDAVTFTDITDTGLVTTLPPGTDLMSFTPPATGAWILSARPVISGRQHVFGPALEVNAVTTPPPPTFATWATGHEFAAGLPAGSISAPSDYNRDGVPNLIAYALGLSPVAPSARLLPQPSATRDSLRLDYPRDTARTDVILLPEISTDLRAWFNPGQTGAPAGFADSILSTSGTIQSRRAVINTTSARTYYLRLRATRL